MPLLRKYTDIPLRKELIEQTLSTAHHILHSKARSSFLACFVGLAGKKTTTQWQ